MVNRRTFLKSASLALGTLRAGAVRVDGGLGRRRRLAGRKAGLTAADLPRGSAPKPVPFPHFPDRLHAFVWRNWQLVPARRMGEVVGASAGEIDAAWAGAWGWRGRRGLRSSSNAASALTIIKRNWHLLPYEQLLQLLGWTAEQMAFSLREDDFLFVKLGNLKPQCERAAVSSARCSHSRTRAGNRTHSCARSFPRGSASRNSRCSSS